MPDSTIIPCARCGRRNRVRPTATGVPQCSVCKTKLPWVVDADASSFEAETLASVPVLVDFWAPWCGPCRMVSPALERIAASHVGQVKVVKVDIDSAPTLAERYRVQGIPLIVLMREGAEVDRRVGAVPEAQLSSWLAPHLAGAR